MTYQDSGETLNFFNPLTHCRSKHKFDEMVTERWDRTHHVPRHKGAHILPNIPMIAQILRHALFGNRLAIRDINTGVEKSYSELILDVAHLRTFLETRLTSSVMKALHDGEEVYIGVLAAGGYEYVVAFLAIMALGAAVVPMSKWIPISCLPAPVLRLTDPDIHIFLGVALPVAEASYFVKTSQQVMMLHSTAAKSLGTSLVDFMSLERGSLIHGVDIGEHLSNDTLRLEDLVLSSDGFPNENAAGLVIFTSGTTGPPKGAVWSRGVIREAAKIFMDTNSIKSTDVVLHVLPVHHATGITITLTPFLMAGACIEFRSGSFDPAWMWNRWRQGGLTFFSGVPTIYMRLMRYFDQHIQHLPKQEVDEFVRGANQFSGMFCGTSSLPAPMQQFWTKMRNGKPMLTRYGGTEFGSVLAVGIGDRGVPVGSVGRPMAGMDIKLSGGDEGEVLVRSPVMFSKLVLSHACGVNILIHQQICVRFGGHKE